MATESCRFMKMFEILSFDSLELLAIRLKKEEQWFRSRSTSNPRDDFFNEVSRCCTIDDIREALLNLRLHEAHSYLCDPKDMIIVKQPYVIPSNNCVHKNGQVYVRQGKTLELRIEATGAPLPTFEWLHHNVSVGTSPLLSISSFSLSDVGTYSCKLQQFRGFGCYKDLISKDISVDLLPEAPQVLNTVPNERKLVLDVGESLTLSVNVSAYPPPTFRWWKHTEILPNQISHTLHIKNVDAQFRGSFECFIQNEAGEARCLFQVDIKEPRPTATEKKAFIIGNDKYIMHKQLSSAVDDAKTLADCLVKYGFDCANSVYSNLNGTDMTDKLRAFCDNLQEGAYVVFYFAGHGFSNSDEPCMMGIDAPSTECNKTYFLREHDVLAMILEKKIALLVIIIDSCQNKFSLQEELPNSDLKMKSEVIRSYATSMNRDAYEKKGSNGIYMRALKSVFDDDLHNGDDTIENMLRKASAQVLQMTGEQQIPERRDTSTRPFRFSDKIKVRQ